MGLFDSIGGGIAQVIGGAVGVNTQDMPDLKKANLDPNTQSLLKNRFDEATAPQSQAESKTVEDENRGVGTGSSFIHGGNVNSPMSQALQDRQGRQFGATVNKIRRSDIVNAPVANFDKVSSTASTMRNDALNAMQFAQAQKQANQNAQFAENNALASILGTAGTIFGTAWGGQAGGAIGGAAGRTAATANGPQGNVGYLNGKNVPNAYGGGG